ncbi:MAG: hypothetical protein ABIG61_12040 [Planctomycetota bacterium]
MKKHSEKLKQLNACLEAIEYADEFSSLQAAWDDCRRGDWLLWLLGKTAGKPRTKSRKKLVLVCCKCARLSLKYVVKGEKRPLRAIKTAEGWAMGKGNITLEDVRAAAYAAYAAAYAADVADAADAADVAAYTAAYAAAYAADVADAADAAYAAAYAADAAAYTAYEKTLVKCATIARQFYPQAPRIRSKP